MPVDPPPGLRKPVTLGDVLRAVAQLHLQVPAELFALVKAIPPIEMPWIPPIEMPWIPPIEVPRFEVPPAVFRIDAELQRMLDRPIGPAEAAPARPEQSPVVPPHILSAADQKVHDRLMQLLEPVNRPAAIAAAKKMGYGRIKFERVWAHFPDERKQKVGSPKGARPRRVALLRQARRG